MHDVLWILLLCSIVVVSMIGGGYLYDATHVHTNETIDATVVGIIVVKTGSGWSSVGESRCVFETDDGERIISDDLCTFIVGDDVVIHYHDDWEKEVTLKANTIE